MGEPRAITYAEVKKAYGKDSTGLNEAWADICTISGAGGVPASEHASIDITDLSDAKTQQIEKLLVPESPVEKKKNTGGTN